MPAKYGNETGLIPLVLAPILYSILVPFGLTFWLLNEFVRLIVSALLWYQYGSGSVTLVEDGNDSVFNSKLKGNTRNVVCVGITKKTPCEPEKYASIFEKNVLLHEVVDESGWFGGARRYRRYEKLEKIMTTRYGFSCWKHDQNFDIRRHFRKIDNADKLYTEKDVLDMLSTLCQDMDESHPQWEYVLIPRYQDSTGVEKSVQIFRFHHAYFDGMSLMLMFKNHLTKGEPELPLNPLTFKIPLWQKMIWYVNALLYGPYMLILSNINKFKTHWILNEQSGGAGKVFAWTEAFDMNTFKQIRQKTNATIPNVIALAFCKAVKNVLPESRVLDTIRFGEIVAMIPYPNENPVNRFSCFGYPVSTGPTPQSQQDFRKEITVLKRNRLAYMIGPQSLVFYYVFKYFGRFPLPILGWVLDGAQDSSYLSNIPSFTEQIDYFGIECENLCPFPPQPNCTGITMASMTYSGKMKLTGIADSAWLSEDEIRRIFLEIPKVVHAIAELGYIPNELPEVKRNQTVENLEIPEEAQIKTETLEKKKFFIGQENSSSEEDEDENENDFNSNNNNNNNHNLTSAAPKYVPVDVRQMKETELENNNNNSTSNDNNLSQSNKEKLSNGHSNLNGHAADTDLKA